MAAVICVNTCRLFTDNFTEELLNLHEAEVKTLEKYYEDHRELFDGVTKWQENWTLYLELDVGSYQLHQRCFYSTRCANLFIFLEKKQRPVSVQQQRREPSEGGEAENRPAEESAQGGHAFSPLLTAPRNTHAKICLVAAGKVSENPNRHVGAGARERVPGQRAEVS